MRIHCLQARAAFCRVEKCEAQITAMNETVAQLEIEIDKLLGNAVALLPVGR